MILSLANLLLSAGRLPPLTKVLPAAAFLLQPGNQPDHHKPGRQHERAGEPAPSRRDPGEDLGHRRQHEPEDNEVGPLGVPVHRRLEDFGGQDDPQRQPQPQRD